MLHRSSDRRNESPPSHSLLWNFTLCYWHCFMLECLKLVRQSLCRSCHWQEVMKPLAHYANARTNFSGTFRKGKRMSAYHKAASPLPNCFPGDAFPVAQAVERRARSSSLVSVIRFCPLTNVSCPAHFQFSVNMLVKGTPSASSLDR